MTAKALNLWHKLLIATATAVLLPHTATAHHSHGNYQVKSLIEIQGVVTKFHLANPHVWIFIDVEDESGEIANWAIEGGSPASFNRSGWSDIVPGDNLTLSCAPSRGENNGCLVKEIQRTEKGSVAEATSGWTSMTFQDDFFSVNFPHQPEVSTAPYESEYGGTFPSTIYTAHDEGGQYSVKVVDFTDVKAVYAAQEDEVTVAGAHNFWFFDQLAAISYAARQFRLGAVEVDYDAWHVIDGIEGHQIYIMNPDETRTYAGIYRHGNRLYILEAKVPNDVPPQGIFQQSLHIIDGDGKRIRYRLLPDHTTERVEIN